MKLAAIYNIWDGTELLNGSVNCIKNHVDEIILVYQTVSNFGEEFNPWSEVDLNDIPNKTLVPYEPNLTVSGTRNEIKKRRIGLDVARDKGCTHFFHIDCDEYYEDFAKAKEFYINSTCSGSVCEIYTYFKKPTLLLEGIENYFVPFIHKLKPTTEVGGLAYPFYVDPTRRVNEMDVICLPIQMHHFSWVRKDIERKVRNSSARGNIQRCGWRGDYETASPGIVVKDIFQRRLVEVENKFSIPSFNS